MLQRIIHNRSTSSPGRYCLLPCVTPPPPGRCQKAFSDLTLRRFRVVLALTGSKARPSPPFRLLGAYSSGCRRVAAASAQRHGKGTASLESLPLWGCASKRWRRTATVSSLRWPTSLRCSACLARCMLLSMPRCRTLRNMLCLYACWFELQLAVPASSWIVGCAQGSSGDYELIRQRVCQHMLANRANFEPFVEDDEKFDDYMRVRTAACMLHLQVAIRTRSVTLNCTAGDGNGWELGRPGETLVVGHKSLSMLRTTGV